MSMLVVTRWVGRRTGWLLLTPAYVSRIHRGSFIRLDHEALRLTEV